MNLNDPLVVLMLPSVVLLPLGVLAAIHTWQENRKQAKADGDVIHNLDNFRPVAKAESVHRTQDEAIQKAVTSFQWRMIERTLKAINEGRLVVGGKSRPVHHGDTWRKP